MSVTVKIQHPWKLRWRRPQVNLLDFLIAPNACLYEPDEGHAIDYSSQCVNIGLRCMVYILFICLQYLKMVTSNCRSQDPKVVLYLHQFTKSFMQYLA